MAHASLKRYSSYVNAMKIILPTGIVLSICLCVGWPYLQSLDKEEITLIDPAHPEIQENRMVQPHYTSTDNKGQPYHVNAEWAKQRTEILADLVSPHGSITTEEGQLLDLKAKNGLYNSKRKILGLEGDVILITSDGYSAKTQKAQITLDTKTIEGNTYFEGQGPAGSMWSQDGFMIKNPPQGQVLTLKGRSRVVITKSALQKDKNTDAL